MVSSENFTFSILNHAGTPLPEYENPFQSAEDVAAGVVSVYVETPPSTDPQNFTIKIAAIKPINYTAHAGYYFDTFFDGVRSAHGIALRRHYAGRSNGATISSFSEIDEAGRNYVDKELMFKPMELENDGPSLAAMRRDANFNPLDVGSIKIQFKEIAGETAAPTVVCYKPKLGAIGGKVNEKAMKGGSSTHSIGTGKTLRVSTTANTVSVIPIGKTYEVKILYRSKSALQNLGIIKREPKPKVKPDPAGRRANREVITIDDSDDEVAAPTPARGVKRERVGTPTRVKPEKKAKQETVVVDMTEDD